MAIYERVRQMSTDEMAYGDEDVLSGLWSV